MGCVGSVLTAPCGDARTSPPCPWPKSLAAAPLTIFRQALRTAAIAVTFLACNSVANSTRPNLSGRVVDETGEPVANATVFVYTAGPKIGSGVVCPSCYADCSKRAKTSAKGAFELPSLDPQLIFRLLVIAPGYESRFVTKVDPAGGDRTITITPLSPEKLKSPNRIGGLVLDEAGKPVVGAVVGPEGAQYGTGTTWAFAIQTATDVQNCGGGRDEWLKVFADGSPHFSPAGIG